MSVSQNQGTMAKRPKYRLTEDQFRILEATFRHKKKLEPELKYQLAHQLGMPEKQVSIWYQNRRARWKTQNTELDYRTIQLRLDTVIMENMSLEREIGRLRVELQEMVLAQNSHSSSVSPISTPYDENSSSSLSGVENFQWQNKETWIDELYAHLLGDE